MNEHLIVTASPHVHTVMTTKSIMRDVLIALLPAAVVSVIYFGLNALVLMVVSVAASVIFEYLSRKVMKRSNTIGDLSAAVTGLLLAFNVPSTLPIWMLVIGDFIAIVIAKQMFGGIGQNFVNPALAGRIILMTSFPAYMTSFVRPFDAVTSATPLAALQGAVRNGVSYADLMANGQATPISDLLLGLHGGVLGEVCAIALIVGFIYLCVRKVITPLIPVCFIGTVALIMFFVGHGDIRFVISELLSGGLMLGAFFMATDYTTSPVNTWGRVIFGIGCGLLTCLIRVFGSMTEGVSFAIILMNIFVPHIERMTTPKPFGYVKEKKEAGK